MAFEITGKLIEVFEIVVVNDNFRKREFVVEKTENAFTDYVKFQLTQDRCNLIDDFRINDEVKVTFNIRGNRWERDGKVNYFNNLGAWRVEKISSQTAAQSDPSFPDASDMPEESEEDDLPF